LLDIESYSRKEILMAKLRHIALHTPDPEKTAEFYKRVFDMAEVGRTDSPIAKGIYLSDGTINLAVLRFKTVEAADRQDGLGPVFGLHHFGFGSKTRMKRAANSKRQAPNIASAVLKRRRPAFSKRSTRDPTP
jgi:catechol 2,3-dioxygenase-like lactoylglutathione lyase family enzyme